jgi:hypothetical protein
VSPKLNRRDIPTPKSESCKWIPLKGRPCRQKELLTKIRSWTWIPPKGRPCRQRELFNKSQNPENGFPRRGDPADRKSVYIYICIYICISIYPYIHISKYPIYPLIIHISKYPYIPAKCIKSYEFYP